MTTDFPAEALSNHDVEPERRLWVAVVKAAWDDLFGKSGTHVQSARQFLTGSGGSKQWRDQVCEMAGLFTGNSLRSRALKKEEESD